MVRIIAGEFRSRRLATPNDDSVSRPYASRVKESVFNLLRGWFEGATVLDLFAGIGTMGLEAASRGAARVYMVEQNRAVYNLLKNNIEALQCGDRVTAVLGDALSATTLARAPRPVDLIFIDPPYEMMEQERSRQLVLDQIARCRALMADKGFVILRGPKLASALDLAIEGFLGPEIHEYGQEMHVLLYAPLISSIKPEWAEAADRPQRT
jgi:16S rRNA (guanine(966)-N(2))-methyltransferase RsmD